MIEALQASAARTVCSISGVSSVGDSAVVVMVESSLEKTSFY